MGVGELYCTVYRFYIPLPIELYSFISIGWSIARMVSRPNRILVVFSPANEYGSEVSRSRMRS